MIAIAQKKEKASALIISMLVIFLVTVGIGIAMTMTNTTMRQTDSSRDFSALRSAAEGSLDYAYGVWAKTINSYYSPVSNSKLTTALGTAPTFTGFTYATNLQLTGTDQYDQPQGAANSTATPPPTRINLDNYPGWVGANTSYLASVQMKGTFIGGRQVQYGVKRAMNYTVVPLFQATAFFENDLELFRPATMTIGGLVHTNNKAYVSSSSSGTLTFAGHLSYVATNGYLDNTDPPQANTWSGWSPNSEVPPTYSNGGKDQQVQQVSRIEPLGTDSSTLLHPPIDSNGNPTGDTNPNDDSMRELIEPPNKAFPDPTPIAQRRLYNKAGIIIHMTVTTVMVKKVATTVVTPTITTQNGTSLTGAQKTALTNSLSQATIYDRREGQNVDLTTLDLSAAKATLNAASGFNGILYIDQTDATGAIANNNPQAIRLVNGSALPSAGLTVASQNPVYIQGDYNTGSQSSRGSAAVFADAVTILSNSWNDSNSSGSLSSRPASSTTVNSAIVAGFLPSGWVNPNTSVQYGYSGGLNNFPRFLEDWTNKTFTYTGSMIELFTSQVAIGQWDTGSIYVPPTRVWNFDSNFVNTPPPGSLDAVTIGRGSLVRSTGLGQY